MRTISKDEKFLRGITLPEQTRTYEPLGHGVMIDTLLEEIDRAGFEVKDGLTFRHAQEGQIMTGVMNLLHPDATETLKISHAKTYINDHVRLHDFVNHEFEL